MQTTTQTFGVVTLTNIKTEFSGCYAVQAEADGQPTTKVVVRPGKSCDFVCELNTKWMRADGTFSPGFKISAADRAILQTEMDAINKATATQHADNRSFANNAQIWE